LEDPLYWACASLAYGAEALLLDGGETAVYVSGAHPPAVDAARLETLLVLVHHLEDVCGDALVHRPTREYVLGAYRLLWLAEDDCASLVD